MNTDVTTAMAFFEVCESGKGWQACRQYCHDTAVFNVQAQSLEHLETVEAYSESMPHLLEILPDARYELVSVATDEERQTVFADQLHFAHQLAHLESPNLYTVLSHH